MIYTLIFFISLALFPWRRFFSWLSKFADIRTLIIGILMISAKFMYDAFFDDIDLVSTSVNSPINSINNTFDLFIPFLTWVFVFAGGIFVGASIYIARMSKKEN